MLSSRYAPLPLLLLAIASNAHAESNKIQAQYWVDLSTSSMTIPGMPEDGAPAGGGLFGSLVGNAMGNGMGNGMGGAMGGGQGKSMNTELWVRARPAGVEASHAIPAAMNMGEALPLLPIRPVQGHNSTSSERTDDKTEKPKGRILLYWGCDEQVRKGQPKILDFASQNYGEFAQFFSSHGRQSKGAQGKPGDSVWPNERDSKPVPQNASMQGAHAVTGDGVPATLKFDVGATNDFLPKARLVASGQPQDSVALSWNSMANASGYFIQAQGGGKADDGSSDLVLWSSSELPENGWSLMNYHSPSQVAKLVQKKVVLAPTVTNCAIPKGIFAKSQGAMASMIAYGPELNVSHPARPQKAPTDWQPDWTARVRVKSTGMTMLGMDDGGDRSDRTGQRGGREEPQQENKVEVPNPVNLLKGIFGR